MPRLTRSHRLLLCGGFAALFYVVGLGGPALWEPDEGRYAEIAREMVVSGDYVTPRDNGVRYFEKPPLVYWAGALAIRTLGRNEFAVRLPAALASVGSIVVTAAAAEMMLGPAVGILAAIALGLSPLFFIFARVATPDPELAFFFTAALMSFYAAATCGDFRTGAGRRLIIAAAALLALATLVKGPVALVLAGAIALLWLLGEGRAREIMRIRWAECVAIYLLITMPWFVLAARRNPGFLAFFFLHEHLQRFLSDTEHGWGAWFFIPIAIAGTWPFFYFAPSGMVALRTATAGGETPSQRGALRFLLLWFATVLVFFSIPRAKLAEYLLPGLPPLAIFAGAGLERVRTMEPLRARRLLRWFAALNGVLALATAGGLLLLRRHGALPLRLNSGAANPAVALVGDALLLLIAVMGMAASIWWLRDQPPRRAPVAIVIMALLITGVLAKARIDATPIFSYRTLANVIAPQLEHGCALASYHHFVQAMPFYTGEQEKLVGYRGELAPFGDSPDAASAFIATDARLRDLWSAPACLVLLVNRKDLPKLAGTLKPTPVLVGCEGKKLALINQRPPVELIQPVWCNGLPPP
ncbi:MAG TPA: phospholipid carrier-dependent glycosyltransferase [Candidatus Binataceae bacterium]|nr:phospholipid carrier-dependent glycosyltransferase [Candidatus Binataceae bacterium]